MAWITPVTDRANEKTRTTYTDMNRIAGNINVACGLSLKANYTADDIVDYDDWVLLVEAVQEYDSKITFSTHYANLNRIEAATQYAKDHPRQRVYPSSSLYPSNALYPLS